MYYSHDGCVRGWHPTPFLDNNTLLHTYKNKNNTYLDIDYVHTKIGCVHLLKRDDLIFVFVFCGGILRLRYGKVYRLYLHVHLS
jgi:hypothetical protein